MSADSRRSTKLYASIALQVRETARVSVYPGAGFLWSLAMAGGSSAPMEDDNLAVEVRRSAFEDLQRADLVMSHVTLPC